MIQFYAYIWTSHSISCKHYVQYRFIGRKKWSTNVENHFSFSNTVGQQSRKSFQDNNFVSIQQTDRKKFYKNITMRTSLARFRYVHKSLTRKQINSLTNTMEFQTWYFIHLATSLASPRQASQILDPLQIQKNQTHTGWLLGRQFCLQKVFLQIKKYQKPNKIKQKISNSIFIKLTFIINRPFEYFNFLFIVIKKAAPIS